MAQLDLIPLELLPDGYRVPDDPTGRSTGERVQRDRPALYAAVVQALAEGMGIRQTARALELHRDTVSAIRDREAHTLGTLKQVTAGNLRRFAAIASERLLEEVDNLSPLQLAIATGIAIDKSQLLEGQATSITEHRDGARVTNLDELIDTMRRATPAQTGFAEGANPPKGLPGSVLGGSDRVGSQAVVDDASTWRAS